ncbi:PWWP domain-containing protein [Mycena indigotica]|uniref:PWWP domain-containing protein n=1 Tax=Mycena indigotica TaxID=2126181 RepID=A0A8H6S0F5_9AGAR|nr:PWWP domain-containing protein [Mycena indigotica]KAF7289751.1 PWWP domain-containing protein [Mycena indigotica]
MSSKKGGDASKAKAKAKAAPKPKVAKEKEPELVFEPRDIVLAKLKGFPPWPGMVIADKDTPPNVREARPVGRKTPSYAVRYFPKGDYTWLAPSVLTPLTSAAIDAFISADPNEKKKKGSGLGRKDLLEAYEVAADPTAWEKEHAAALKEAASKKKGGKKVKEEVEEDELADEEPAETGTKRKRSVASTTTKSKAKAPVKKAPAQKAAASKSKGRKAPKSKATIESEDENEKDGDGEEAASDAEDGRPKKKPKTTAKGAAAKGKAAKAVKAPVAKTSEELEEDPEAVKVREWRHRLQKGFLNSNKPPPKESEMPSFDELFTAIESYEGMTVDYLTFSKIGKVMRHVNLLPEDRIPRDDEFKFRDRATALVAKWGVILNGATGAAGTDGHVNGAVNGDDDGEGEGDLTMMEQD